MTMYRLNR